MAPPEQHARVARPSRGACAGRAGRGARIGRAALLLALLGAGSACGVDRDEFVRFFPTYGFRSAPQEWTLNVHGWIYEPEGRELLVLSLVDLLDLEDELEVRDRVFAERAGLFLVDNERAERLRIRVAGRVHDLPLSTPDGHFQGRIRVAGSELAAHGDPAAAVAFHAVTRRNDPRAFAGVVRLIGPEGVSVVSDIDDTIRVADVSDREELLKNTFIRPYRAVEGMADLFRRWAEAGDVAFHYVSGSPWQLAGVIEQFLADEAFPPGSLHLRRFRLAEAPTVRAMLEAPVESKRAALETLLADFPRRRFVFVGDSSEQDPELYGALARAHPEQLEMILIREIPGRESGADRYRKAFEGVPAARWGVFGAPAGVTYVPAR